LHLRATRAELLIALATHLRTTRTELLIALATHLRATRAELLIALATHLWTTWAKLLIALATHLRAARAKLLHALAPHLRAAGILHLGTTPPLLHLLPAHHHAALLHAIQRFGGDAIGTAAAHPRAAALRPEATLDPHLRTIAILTPDLDLNLAPRGVRATRARSFPAQDADISIARSRAFAGRFDPLARSALGTAGVARSLGACKGSRRQNGRDGQVRVQIHESFSKKRPA
jgi:hypothetical protein